MKVDSWLATRGGNGRSVVLQCVSSVCPTQFIERQKQKKKNKKKQKKEILTDGKLQTKNT